MHIISSQYAYVTVCVVLGMSKMGGCYYPIPAYVIMPNHVHGILAIQRDLVIKRGNNDLRRVVDLRCRDVACNVPTAIDAPNGHMREISPVKQSLAVAIRSYKSACSNLIRKSHIKHFEWQQRYYDRKIRDEREYINTRNYIINNPKK